MIDRTPKPCHHPKVNHRHGTYACYTLDACRCLPCAFACSSYLAELRSVHASGEQTLVDPTRAAAHVAELNRSGWTIKGIAEKAGVSTTTVQRINSPTRRPARIKADVEAAVLAVQGSGQRYMTDAVGMVRRIRALATLGWSFRQIGERCGITQRSIVDINTGGIKNVRPETFTAICAVYDELWDKPAPDRRDGIRDRMIRYARRNGWAPPLAWDDDSIDDPAATPTIYGTEETIRRNLHAQGLSDRAMSRELGLRPDAIRDWRVQAGLPSNYQPRGRSA